MIPNGEKVVADHVRDATGYRVVSKTPDTIVDPWIRYTQLDARQIRRPDHLVEFYIQFDCYAGKDGGQPEATAIGRELRAALQELPGTSDDEVVVSEVRINGDARIPDLDFEGARERKVLTALIYMHSV